MTTWARWLAGAAVLALLAPSAGRAAELQSGERIVPLASTGRIPLDLRAGPIQFHELLVQGVPSDPEVVAARPAEEPILLRLLAVASNVGSDDADFRMDVQFLDEQGQTVFRCTDAEDQDEGDFEVHELCKLPGTLKQWARVRQVRFQVQITDEG